MHPSHAHHQSRVFATLGAAMAHGYLATIGSAGYLNFTVPSEYPLLHLMASSHVWTWIHAGVTVVLLSSLHKPYKPCWLGTNRAAAACSVGFATMFIWAFFNMLWGLSTISPVSLAGPGLAFAVAAGEQLLAHAWNRGAPTKDR